MLSGMLDGEVDGNPSQVDYLAQERRGINPMAFEHFFDNHD